MDTDEAPFPARPAPQRLTIRQIMVIIAIVAGASGAGGGAMSLGLDADDLNRNTAAERERADERYARGDDVIRMDAKLDAIGDGLRELKTEVLGVRDDVRRIERSRD